MLFMAPATRIQYWVLGSNVKEARTRSVVPELQGETAVNEDGVQLPSPESTTTLISSSIPGTSGQSMPLSPTSTGPPKVLVVKVYHSTASVAGQNPGMPAAPVLSATTGCCAHSNAALAQSLFAGWASVGCMAKAKRAKVNAVRMITTNRTAHECSHGHAEGRRGGSCEEVATVRTFTQDSVECKGSLPPALSETADYVLQQKDG